MVRANAYISLTANIGLMVGMWVFVTYSIDNTLAQASLSMQISKDQQALRKIVTEHMNHVNSD